MSDSDSSDDWVAGGTLEATAGNLTFFNGSSIAVETSRLPDPPDEPDVA